MKTPYELDSDLEDAEVLYYDMIDHAEFLLEAAEREYDKGMENYRK
jgi:hypothetical protein